MKKYNSSQSFHLVLQQTIKKVYFVVILHFVCSVLFSDSLFLFDFVLVFIFNITFALVPVFVAVTLH